MINRGRKKLLSVLSEQLIILMREHEGFCTLPNGENFFILNTGNNEYKIMIEKIGGLVNGRKNTI